MPFSWRLLGQGLRIARWTIPTRLSESRTLSYSDKDTSSKTFGAGKAKALQSWTTALRRHQPQFRPVSHPQSEDKFPVHSIKKRMLIQLVHIHNQLPRNVIYHWQKIQCCKGVETTLPDMKPVRNHGVTKETVRWIHSYLYKASNTYMKPRERFIFRNQRRYISPRLSY